MQNVYLFKPVLTCYWAVLKKNQLQGVLLLYLDLSELLTAYECIHMTLFHYLFLVLIIPYVSTTLQQPQVGTKTQ